MSVNKRHDKQEQEKWDTQKLSGKISLPVSLINCCLNQTVVLFGFWYLHGSCFPCRNVKQFYQYCKQKKWKNEVVFLKKDHSFRDPITLSTMWHDKAPKCKSFIFNRGAENEERIKSQVQRELESVISEDNYKACKKKSEWFVIICI